MRTESLKKLSGYEGVSTSERPNDTRKNCWGYCFKDITRKTCCCLSGASVLTITGFLEYVVVDKIILSSKDINVIFPGTLLALLPLAPCCFFFCTPFLCKKSFQQKKPYQEVEQKEAQTEMKELTEEQKQIQTGQTQVDETSIEV